MYPIGTVIIDDYMAGEVTAIDADAGSYNVTWDTGNGSSTVVTYSLDVTGWEKVIDVTQAEAGAVLTAMTDAAYGPQEPVSTLLGGVELDGMAYLRLVSAISEVTGNHDNGTLARDAAYLAQVSPRARDAAAAASNYEYSKAFLADVMAAIFEVTAA